MYHLITSRSKWVGEADNIYQVGVRLPWTGETQQILIPEHIEVLEHDIYTINAWVLTLERQSVSGMIQMMTILVIHDLNPNGASSINSQISNLG